MLIGLFCSYGQVLAQMSPTNENEELLSMADSLFKDLRISDLDSLNHQMQQTQVDSLAQIVQSRSKKKLNWDLWYKAFLIEKSIAYSNRDYELLIDSIKFYLKFVPEEEKQLKGRLQFLMALSYHFDGDYVTSAELNLENIKLLKEAKDSVFTLSTYINLSGDYSRIGDDLSALDLIEEGIAYLGDKPTNGYYSLLQANKGIFLFYKNDLQGCIDVFRSNLKKGVFKKGSYNKARAYSYISRSLLKLGQYHQAKKYLDSIQWNKYSEFEFRTAASEYFQSLGDFGKAKQHRIRAMELRKGNVEPRFYLKEISKLAMLEWEFGNREEAMQRAHQALCIHFKDLDSLDYLDKPDLDRFVPETWVIEAAFVKAQYYKELESDSAIYDPNGQTSFYFDLIFEMYDDIKKNHFSNESKFKMGAYSQDMYEDALSFYLNNWNQTKKDESFDKALKIAQLSNAYVLRNTSSTLQALHEASIPQNLIYKYSSLKNALAESVKQQDVDLIDSLIQPLNELEDHFENMYPTYNSLTNSKILNLNDIQKRLDDESLVLKYILQGSKMYVFMISNSRSDIITLDFSQHHLELISQFRRALLNSKNDEGQAQEVEFCELSKQVYDHILEPVLSKASYRQFRNICIVPDGPLKNLAINALMHKESKNWSDPRNFIIDQYNISYFYYLGQLVALPSKEKNSEYVGFGIQYADEMLTSNFIDSTEVKVIANLKELKNSADEVKSAAELLGGEHFLEEEVTVDLIEKYMNSTSIVHFAVHALVDPTDFKKSFILLSGKNQNQFQLDYKQILNFGIGNDLTVLSACQTGIGQDIDGEGLMSLSRAFTYGGSQSTLGSFWNVPDRATMHLMNLFYEGLKNGYNKSDALRQAQIQYLTNDDLSSPSVRAPYYWAGWALNGNIEPLTLSPSNSFSPYWLIPGILVSLLIFTLFRGKRTYWTFI